MFLIKIPLWNKIHPGTAKPAPKFHAERSEASRSLNRGVLPAMNEILRHFVSQNDIGQEPVISSEPRSGDREIPVMLLTKIPLWNKPHPNAAKPAHQCHAEPIRLRLVNLRRITIHRNALIGFKNSE